jgi:endoglucanase
MIRVGPVRLPGERPEVRINQLGYRPTGPKRAVWVSDMREPAAFCVCDRGGAAVFGGRTRPWPVRPEPTSGMAVHVLDFSDLRAEGEGFAIEVDGARSHAFALAGDLYRGLVRDALAFSTSSAPGSRSTRPGRPVTDARRGTPATGVSRPGPAPTLSGCTPVGRVRAALTSRVAGTTRATTAST